MKKNLKEMRDIAIYGAGGLGRETALLINQINAVKPEWTLVGFYDDGKSKNEIVDDLPILGALQDLQNHAHPLAVVIAIAHSATRKKVRNSLSGGNINFPALVHPSVILGDIKRNSIGEGVIIGAGTILTTNIYLQPFVIINLSCTIGHDIVIGEFASIMPGCSLSGFLTIGEEVLIGTGAKILPQITIGSYSVVGAGAVVTEHVAERTTVVGVPAKPI
jgi:sugar O-acyltransferase (sialic acid O-acetyltransferase NeuD family)